MEAGKPTFFIIISSRFASICRSPFYTDPQTDKNVAIVVRCIFLITVAGGQGTIEEYRFLLWIDRFVAKTRNVAERWTEREDGQTVASRTAR